MAPIKLDSPRTIWIFLLAIIDTTTIPFWYNFLRTCNNINDVRLESLVITSPCNNVIRQSKNINFTAENINVEQKFFIFWHPFRKIFHAIFGFVCQQKVTLQQFVSGTTLKRNYTVINVVCTASLVNTSHRIKTTS